LQPGAGGTVVRLQIARQKVESHAR
jgi:hypothetical protein